MVIHSDSLWDKILLTPWNAVRLFRGDFELGPEPRRNQKHAMGGLRSEEAAYLPLKSPRMKATVISPVT